MLTRLLAMMLAAIMMMHPGRSWAWGDEGHKIVALIAYRHLTPAVRTRVDAMLRADRDPLTPPDIASRATWADRYRESDHGSTKLHYSLTREWHFVDIELEHPDLTAACFGHPPPAVPASAGPAKACVVDRIAAFAAELHDLPSHDPERLTALRFLLHLVGDLHQPLHAADNHDRGGNEVLVLYGRHVVGQSLHGYWDKDTVVRLGGDPEKVARALERRFAAKCKGWASGTPAEWALESFSVAKDVVYRLGETTADRKGQPVYRLSQRYQSHAATVAGMQLEKAGCRLAMVLNDALR